jgi:DNA replication protein DnaC
MTYDIAQMQPMKRHWLAKSSNIPSRFFGLEPSDMVAHTGSFPEEIAGWLSLVNEGKIIKAIGGLGDTGVGLLFDGAPGLGKTTHAVVSLMELVRSLPDEEAGLRKVLKYHGDDLTLNSRPVYYMTFPEFLSRKKAMMDADPDSKRVMFQEMEGLHGRAADDRLNVRVLVLDDLGKEYKGNGYNDASFDEVLRSRYDKGLPTIITTNVDRENWAKQYGEAMGSFAHEAFTRVRILGEDLRKK